MARLVSAPIPAHLVNRPFHRELRYLVRHAARVVGTVRDILLKSSGGASHQSNGMFVRLLATSAPPVPKGVYPVRREGVEPPQPEPLGYSQLVSPMSSADASCWVSLYTDPQRSVFS